MGNCGIFHETHFKKTIQFFIFVRSFAFAIVAVSQSSPFCLFSRGVHFIKMLSSARPLKESQRATKQFFISPQAENLKVAKNEKRQENLLHFCKSYTFCVFITGKFSSLMSLDSFLYVYLCKTITRSYHISSSYTSWQLQIAPTTDWPRKKGASRNHKKEQKQHEKVMAEHETKFQKKKKICSALPNTVNSRVLSLPFFSALLR